MHELLSGSSPSCRQHCSHATLLLAASLTLSFLNTFLMLKADEKLLFTSTFLLGEYSARSCFLPCSCKHAWKESSCKDDLRASHLSSDINKYLLFGIKTSFTPQSAVLQHYLYTTFILHFYWESFISNKAFCDAWETLVFNACVVFLF